MHNALAIQLCPGTKQNNNTQPWCCSFARDVDMEQIFLVFAPQTVVTPVVAARGRRGRAGDSIPRVQTLSILNRR